MAFTQRSQASRDAVLAAARRAFSAHGFDKATVRAIATEAGVDPSMVIRYFTSKDELFRAATAVDLALPDLTRVAPPTRGRVLAERFVALWDDETTGQVLTLLLRSAPTSERAAERIRDVFSGQVLAMVSTLGAGEPADPAAATRRAGALSSYILGTALCRYVLGIPSVADRSPDEVVALMAPVIQSILSSSTDPPHSPGQL